MKKPDSVFLEFYPMNSIKGDKLKAVLIEV